jgi:hypothetical protein
MPAVIEITRTFPPTRERTVLIELLRVVRNFQDQGINPVICGGWVPFLKELARTSHTTHSMSLDIDMMLRDAARDREIIDRIKMLLSKTMEFQPSRDNAFRYEKAVEGNIVQLDLLTDSPRTREDQSVIRLHGIKTTLDLCLVDGAEDLDDHVETILIDWRDGETVQRGELTIPDPAGFLLLKTAVCGYRENPKDPYDIYYYCRYSEDLDVIRQNLASANHSPSIQRAMSELQRMFKYEDSKWVEMALDHMLITGDERDREARFIVRAIMRVVDGL